MEVELTEKSSFKLNPFFRVSFGPPITCELFLENKSVILPNSQYLQLLNDFKTPKPFFALIALTTCTLNLNRTEAKEVLTDLIQQQLLVPSEKEFPKMSSVKHWVNRGWLEALMLHLKSKDISFDDDLVADPDNYNAKVLANLIDKEGTPNFWKEYPDKTNFALPKPKNPPSDKTLQDVLLQRRSNRPWCIGHLTIEQLSIILYYANLETYFLRTEAEKNYNTNPELLLNSAFSALETYFFVFKVDGLTPGLYHYDPRKHQVTLIKEGHFENEVVRMCIGQDRPKGAACTFVISSVWKRYMYRYRHARAYRTLLVNVAELAQKYILLATALNFSNFLTPALQDEYADELLGVNGYEEAPLYVVAIG
ncbi:SagB/ThcOx family dehydrogenase [Bacillus sp. IBL03825]|uniref:SagB/ThcOx family dehydrogenase n=1 Tax=Bacillus sp. IBL03825 TaxID=2953580 RepID=UPI002157EF36|nr:SagB/ThcOx family dehydrogenase [Bacillus sp. IBL03825]MCR6850384.1 SagB/ThcOx family dehydrogenase [Bacillus sp. IBL03825]